MTSYALFLFLLSALPTLQASSPGVFFVRSPESAVAPKFDEVLFECEVNLEPERLEWTYRRLKSPGVSSSNKFKYLPSGAVNYNISTGLLASKLRVVVTPETLGEYRCVSWFGPVALVSTTAHLLLATISIDKDTEEVFSKNVQWTVAAKNTILLRCGSIKSQPPAVWSFYRNGEKLQQYEVLTTSGTLVLDSISANDSGNYTCSATNTVAGEVVWLPRSVELHVDHNYMARKAPYFLESRMATNVVARVGETAVLECPGVAQPKPKAIWSSPDIANIHNNRTYVLPYGFKISEVRSEDEGTYICRLDNGVAPALGHMITLFVHYPPKIVNGPQASLTNEGESLELFCNATGNPEPDIYWLINDESIAQDSEASIFKGTLLIRRVQKRHAAFVQCFARNELGEVSAGTLLQVNPKQIKDEAEHAGGTKKPGKRKYGKNTDMVPPSAPNVTRLSDESVMLRWQVPKNNGLPIQFFKVQYRMLGDSTRKISRDNWQTTNEDIPYGKRNRNTAFGKSFTSSVNGLKPDCFYKFRIIAVYSNDDNKESTTSAKFFLQRGSSLGKAESNLPVPELIEVEAYSETSVVLHWILDDEIIENSVEGFYAYYRQSSSAGEYFKSTIEGSQARKFKIGTLEPGTFYEFKLQSFNSYSASEFSSLKQGRTLKPKTTPAPTVPTVTSTTPANSETYTMYPLMAGIVCGGSLLLLAVVAACLCIRRRKNTQPEDEDKPHLEPMCDDFVAIGTYSQHKSRQRINGVRQHMHITLNPLAQHDDKSSPNHLPQNHEQAFFQRQPNNQGYDVTDSNYNGHIHSSLRRSHRTLERGNNNNHTYDSHAINGGSPRTHSPKIGLVVHKRARLSSRSDTLSSASLNSVGV